jgi:general secretion pathway protein K
LINQNKQSGAAIVVALFVTALVAAMSIAMMERMRTDIHRTELLLNNIQANQYAQGSIYWAMDVLINNYLQKIPGKVIDQTPVRSPISKLNGAEISSVIYDAQGKFNLNNLTDPPSQHLFMELLAILQPSMDKNLVKKITLNIVDWITPGLNNTELDKYYSKLSPAYRSPHHAMVSVSELRTIKDITPALFNLLSPYVTALPDKTKLNINSVSIPILMSFSPTITADIAKAFDSARRKTPFASLETLGNFAMIKESPLAQSNLLAESAFFMVKTQVLLGKQQVEFYTLLMRLLKDEKPMVIIVWQSKGTL